jgi:hypothetical protein
MKILVSYFAVAFFFELLGLYLINKGFNNLWMTHVYSIIEYTLLIIVFSCWQKNQMFRKILQWSIPVFAIMGITNMIRLQDLHHVNSYGLTVEGMILVGVSAYTLFELNREGAGSLLREPRFLIGTGVLLYFTSTVIFFALSNVLLSFPRQTALLVWSLHNMVNILANFVYAGGILCQYPAQKSGGH